MVTLARQRKFINQKGYSLALTPSKAAGSQSPENLSVWAKKPLAATEGQ